MSWQVPPIRRSSSSRTRAAADNRVVCYSFFMLERMSPPAKKIIELSLREALQLGHSDIRPEHILLALLRLDEGIVASALDKDGSRPDLRPPIRNRVIQALRDSLPENNILPVCCGQPMAYQEAFGTRRYECRYRPHHPAVWVDMKTKKHLTDDDLPRQDQ